MVAPNYAAARSRLAKQMRLGQKATPTQVDRLLPAWRPVRAGPVRLAEPQAAGNCQWLDPTGAVRRAMGSMSRLAEFLLVVGWGLATTEEIFSMCYARFQHVQLAKSVARSP
jgi:hypothetical protein